MVCLKKSQNLRSCYCTKTNSGHNFALAYYFRYPVKIYTKFCHFLVAKQCQLLVSLHWFAGHGYRVGVFFARLFDCSGPLLQWEGRHDVTFFTSSNHLISSQHLFLLSHSFCGKLHQVWKSFIRYGHWTQIFCYSHLISQNVYENENIISVAFWLFFFSPGQVRTWSSFLFIFAR